MKYCVAIHKDKDSDYGVTALDIPGCFSAGKTLEEALEAVKEAIEGHIELLLEEGEALPKSLPMDQYRNSPESQGAHLYFVEIDISKKQIDKHVEKE